MTESGLKPIIPDALTGMIFAMEGIRNTIVLLNGPMGCRFYHSTTSQFLSIRPLLYLPSQEGNRVPVDYNYLNNWFFRQQRVPCTYLDGYDYVYGTAEKVREGILYIREHISFELLVIINAPGASLIGDMLEDLADELLPDKAHLVLESPGFSTSYADGCASANLQLLQKLLGDGAHSSAQVPQDAAEDSDAAADGQKHPSANHPETNPKPIVNVLGLSIFNRYFEGDREEIGRILKLCGIEVNLFLCADCSVSEIRNIPRADLNLVLDPQIGLPAAEYLKEQVGIPFYCCDALPIGFDAVETFCTALCKQLHTDASALLEESHRARAYAWYKVNAIYQSSGLPKGALFTVEGSRSQNEAYTKFFTEYLGMKAAAPEECQLYFGDANQIAGLMTRHQVFCGIEINLPGMGYTDLVKKTHLGVQGALFLIEQVLNGLMSRL